MGTVVTEDEFTGGLEGSGAAAYVMLFLPNGAEMGEWGVGRLRYARASMWGSCPLKLSPWELAPARSRSRRRTTCLHRQD
jgi:hypothetical protein